MVAGTTIKDITILSRNTPAGSSNRSITVVEKVVVILFLLRFQHRLTHLLITTEVATILLPAGITAAEKKIGLPV